jgi:hypothetical protein
MEAILFTSYGLKTLELTIVLLHFSYMLGMLWIIMCEVIEDFIHGVNYYDLGIDVALELYPDTFITNFNLIENTPPQNTIVLSYFMFTSLSTVGFGDLHPRGDFERLACAFILLFGVAIFSYIMGIFIEILEQFQNYNADLDYGDSLN